MAIYHFSAQVISRSQGRSSVAASAYRSGEKLEDERTGLVHDYTRKSRIIYNEILTPNNVPEWAKDRLKLWNEVEKIEKSKDSQVAREINIALPKELNKEQNIELIRSFVKDNFVSRGMIADIAIHDSNNDDKNKDSIVPLEERNNNKNIHVHVMLTMRPFNEDGTWGAKSKKEYILNKKGEKIKLKSGEYKSRKIETTDWNKKETLENWREQWATYANKSLEKAGFDERIDYRTLEAQGIDKIAEIHVGVHANAMAKKGIESDRARINNEIKELNKEKVIALEEYKKIKVELENEKSEKSQRYSNLKPGEIAAIEKTEKIIKQSLTYENSKEALEKLNAMKEERILKLSEINSNAVKINKRLYIINNSLEGIKKAEKELNELPKNIFGKYKDKNKAEIIKANIKRYNNELADTGYRNSADIMLSERRLENLQNQIDKLKLDAEGIDNILNTIKMGVKALQNKEIREFYKEYKEHFPQSKYYFNYDEMKAVKAIGESMGRPVSVKDIKISYKSYGSKLENIDKELKSINDNERRLINARKAIEIIDKYKDIAKKWDTKILGKAKFQKEHINDKLAFDNSKVELKTYGVRDKADLLHQERIYKSKINTIQPKLQKDRINVFSAMNILRCALQAISNSQRSAQQHDDLQLTKAFRRKDLEDDLSL